ncbi:hypothetical protein BCR44DRAFT_1284716 [Catenaria anguillulae PL171]|uniref:Uncharacterized protein n=1 Tax=Catenaria anguillulae PL171 TaxID=765915 RepID=A0A1Y2HWI1_9FUNG|nr:hypothetical protein BCR44DRAFT_1284716 [Catenaria anguillulae PL171]
MGWDCTSNVGHVETNGREPAKFLPRLLHFTRGNGKLFGRSPASARLLSLTTVVRSLRRSRLCPHKTGPSQPAKRGVAKRDCDTRKGLAVHIQAHVSRRRKTDEGRAKARLRPRLLRKKLAHSSDLSRQCRWGRGRR